VDPYLMLQMDAPEFVNAIKHRDGYPQNLWNRGL
jgi:hypothetical protein